jgi:hypothetical protein
MLETHYARGYDAMLMKQIQPGVDRRTPALLERRGVDASSCLPSALDWPR